MTVNPARLVRHRPESNARVRYLSPAEERKLRQGIGEKYSEHLPEFDLALNTGLRLSEMYGLTWDNVNLARRVLTVPRCKNGEMRHVPLNQAVVAALKALRVRCDGTGPVIRNQAGVPLAGPRHWFKPALEVAKIEDFTWHCLRHTFASRLVMDGVDLRTVQELLGHNQISMTVGYSHLAPNHQLAAVERLTAQAEQAPQEGPTDTKISTGQTQLVQPEGA